MRKMLTNKDMVEHWRRVGPILERIRKQELRELDFKRDWKIIDALLQLGCDHGVPRNMSGLVELQRILAKSVKRRRQK